MANECSNTLHITGPSEILRKFVQENRDSEKSLSLSKSVPVPPDMENSHEWYHSNWGTKRDVDYVVDLDESYPEGEVIYDFVTAWTPIIPWVKLVATKYPELEFQLTYVETAAEFAGEYFVKGSEDQHIEYGPEDDEYRELAGIEDEDVEEDD
jgi:hypothetical protein